MRIKVKFKVPKMRNSRIKFKSIFGDDNLELPLSWDDVDFYKTLSRHFNFYKEKVMSISIEEWNVLNQIEIICEKILKCIKEYHNGFPHKAFNEFSKLMIKLKMHPFHSYNKTGFTDIASPLDPLKLFRIRHTDNAELIERKEIFHTPGISRAKIATGRYSIPGYPCLYLGTTLKLCSKEVKKTDEEHNTLASRLQLVRDFRENGELSIEVIETGLKPSDFLQKWDNNHNLSERQKHLSEIDLQKEKTIKNYIYWYPLIAASSFIRNNKQDPFSSEYIIPQLLLQWVRTQEQNDKLVGIRYFSCASKEASELGMNYVFPVSGKVESKHGKYCKILSKAFKLTKPVYIDSSSSLDAYQKSLEEDRVIDYL